MNTDSTNKWLSLVANVGVLIGLFLVAYEVRQTNAALDRDYDVFWTDVQGRSREGWREFNGRIIESAEVADIWMRGGAGEELSPVESQRFRYLANDVLLLYQQMFDQWQILGRDTESLFNWLDSSIEDRPGLRKELVRIVEVDRDAAFVRTILEGYPELLVED